jgi:uncharacterized phage protein (TIGR02218 family)
MKSASAALIALLATDNFLMADLYTFTLNNGTIYRFTNYDIDIIWNGVSFTKNGLSFQRNGTKITTGVEVDTLDITVYQKDTSFEGIGILRVVANGGLDGSDFKLERLFFDDPLTPIGSIWMFSGRVSQCEATRYEAKITVNSDLELLNVQMPRNLFQAPCIHTPYDTGCGIPKTGVAGTIISVNGTTFGVSIYNADSYYDEGMIEFTSGSNTGAKRTIKNQVSNLVTVTLGLSSTVNIGDTIKLYAGCDRTQATCQNKFNNLLNFRGFPYVPVPETTM